MKKRKNIFKYFMLIISIFMITGCNSSRIPAHQKQNYNVAVTYDVQDGRFTNYTPNDNKLKFMTKAGNHIPEPKTAEMSDVNISGFIKVFYLGYTNEGWYLNYEDGEYTNKWDFANMTVGEEDITLYAKWVKDINLSYSIMVYDAEEDKEIVAETVDVAAGDKLDMKLEPKCNGYTFLEGYFQDKECTIPWDNTFEHPGGDVDTTVKVYAKWIKGNFKLIRTAQEFKTNCTANIYLLDDIDFANVDWTLLSTYRGTIEGNGFTIKNITINSKTFNAKDGTSITETYVGLYKNLVGATIRNVTFENISLEVGAELYNTIYISPLAGKIRGDSVIENVTINGVINIVKSKEGKNVVYDAMKLGYEIEEKVTISNSTITVNVVDNA